jgi:hypothetical protein
MKSFDRMERIRNGRRSGRRFWRDAGQRQKSEPRNTQNTRTLMKTLDWMDRIRNGRRSVWRFWRVEYHSGIWEYVGQFATQAAHDLLQAAQSDALLTQLQPVQRRGTQPDFFGEHGVGQISALAAQELAQLLFQNLFQQSQYLAVPYPICGINSFENPSFLLAYRPRNPMLFPI